MAKPQEKHDHEIVQHFFIARQLEAKPIPETKVGKVPDFAITSGVSIVAYCEVKSPQDVFRERVEDAINQAEGKISGIIEHGHKSRQYRCLERAAQKASEQFDAVNLSHSVPNILMIVNHDSHSIHEDFKEVLTGYFANIRSGPALRDAIPKIDVYLWVDGKTERVVEWILRYQNPFKEYLRSLLKLDGLRN